ncbi:hypothetical protein [Nonomuraea sediminis]|uniref:hypothetical protein n=1 Tax=Nonomuraea sediminis TaxID=2835864 RepID=UPI001BDC0323|nr:hypothetical protein [Nonomuraea sediminis]
MRRGVWAAVLGAAVSMTVVSAVPTLADTASGSEQRADVRIQSPRAGASTGVEGAAWTMELSVHYRDGLKAAGWSGPQVTGPQGGTGTFGPGKDDKLPGLVVLLSTTTGFSGPGTNLANLFNVTGVAQRDQSGTRIWDSWLVGKALFGKDVDSVVTVAVVKDLDGNGVLDDAPDVVKDVTGDGRVDARDLRELGVASNVAALPFRISGAAA